MKESSRRNNCLNTVRIIAATQVMVGHAIPWLGLPKLGGVLRIINGMLNGVPIFFIISGYLIFFSINNSKSVKEYALKRFFRIYPELWVAVIVEMIVLLILYDQPVPVKDIVLFSFTQGTIFQFWTPDSLRGYGNGTPNGALWTITVIVQFYIVAWPLFRLLKNKKIHVWIITDICFGLVSVLLNVFESAFPVIVFKLLRNSFIPYMWLFISGAIVALIGEKALRFLERYWILLMLIAAVLITFDVDIQTANYGIVRSLMMGFALLSFSYKYPRLNIKTDFSYELYLYHVTVINALITLGLTGRYEYLVLTIAISVGLAMTSKLTVGRIDYKTFKEHKLAKN